MRQRRYHGRTNNPNRDRWASVHAFTFIRSHEHASSHPNIDPSGDVDSSAYYHSNSNNDTSPDAHIDSDPESFAHSRACCFANCDA